MKKLLAGLLTTTALLVLTLSTQAQTPGAATDYTGPCFPGGPDSLRALVYRATRLAGPAPAGRMLMQFDLQGGLRPHNFELVVPPGPKKRELTKAAEAALAYLQARMPGWQPGTPNPESKADTEPKIGIVLDFTTAQATQPYCYADQEPVFPDLAALLAAQGNRYLDNYLKNPATRARLDSSPRGLATYVQMQAKYPMEAMRNGQQGQVFAYFEVAENGAIERPEIVGTAGNALDAAVVQTIKTLPTAANPALLRGLPVRVYYVLPITFKMVASRR